MTHNDINQFLTAMSEAKRALDAEPQYRHDIGRLQDHVLQLVQTVAARELRIHELKQNEETLVAKLRSVEAERDDAGFRALEEADKVSNLRLLVLKFIGEGLEAVSTVDGLKQIVVRQDVLDDLVGFKDLAQARYDHIQQLENELSKLRDDVKLPQEQLLRPFAAVTVQGTEEGSGSGGISSSAAHEPWSPEGQSVADPTSAANPEVASHTDTVSTSGTVSGLTMKTDRAESEADPTTTTLSNIPTEVSFTGQGGDGDTAPGQSDGPFAPMETTLSQPATSTGAETTTAVASNASGPERNRDESTRFAGRKYFDVTYFVPLHEWLNKGGARQDYYWRPAEANVPLPEPSRASHQSS